jgi:glucose-6-phosphate 1-dehydrogenase
MGTAISDALVLFGATGDLAQKKIYPALYAMMTRGHLDVPVIGVARGGTRIDGLRQRVRDSVLKHGGHDGDALARLSALLRYVDGDYRDPAVYRYLHEALGGARRPLYYLAISPTMFETVVQGLKQVGCDEARVVVEKPFGRDLASARKLNSILGSVFDESAIFRIDHYLGKEAVQNLMYFRFANSFLEPIWNRNYVASVQVTMAESFGVEGRGRFYEEVGAVRDVVQNHMLQVVANLAMEPPVGAGSEAMRDEKVKVFRGVRSLTGRSLVRGQYDGYRRENGVNPESEVETYAAMQLHIDSWRWQGVPFYIRAGKCLPITATEIWVELREPPQKLFDEAVPNGSNYVRFRLGPDRVAIALGARTKQPGTAMVGSGVELYVCNDKGGEMDAYERLMGDAMKGDAALFARWDAVEAAWRIVDPILGMKSRIHAYRAGSWGPPEANRMIGNAGNWHEPNPAVC